MMGELDDVLAALRHIEEFSVEQTQLQGKLARDHSDGRSGNIVAAAMAGVEPLPSVSAPSALRRRADQATVGMGDADVSLRHLESLRRALASEQEAANAPVPAMADDIIRAVHRHKMASEEANAKAAAAAFAAGRVNVAQARYDAARMALRRPDGVELFRPPSGADRDKVVSTLRALSALGPAPATRTADTDPAQASVRLAVNDCVERINRARRAARNTLLAIQSRIDACECAVVAGHDLIEQRKRALVAAEASVKALQVARQCKLRILEVAREQ